MRLETDPQSTDRGYGGGVRTRFRLDELADGALALFLFGTGVWFVLGSPFEEDVVRGPAWVNLATVAFMTLPLAFRRRAPLAVTAVVFGALGLRALVAEPLEIYTGPVAGIVATYSVAAYGSMRAAVAGLALTLPCVALAAARGTGGDASPDFVPVTILLSLVWAVGRVAGTRYASAWTLDRRREEQAREAVAAERERIARELHDSVSHSLGVIAMQAGGAEAILRRDPERAAESLRSIERVARDGLTDMRRMLGLISQGDEGSAELTPQPGIDRLPALIVNARGAGLNAELKSQGEARPVAPAVELSAYRIAQEALTNAAKHGGRCRVLVALRWSPAALEVEVVDDGAAQQNGVGTGRGLIGMRERATMVGGRLEVGPRPTGGYRVWARLPLEPPS